MNKNIITGPWRRAPRQQALGLRVWLSDCAPDLILLCGLTTLIGVFIYDYVKQHNRERVRARLGTLEQACVRERRRPSAAPMANCLEYAAAAERACTMGLLEACKNTSPKEIP